jgi:hypothetical protein
MSRDELEHAIETSFEQHVALLFTNLCHGNALEAGSETLQRGLALERFEAGFRIAVDARDQAMASIDKVLSATKAKDD